MERIERQQHRAMVQAGRGVTRPGRADRHRRRAAEQQRPPRARPAGGARAASAAMTSTTAASARATVARKYWVAIRRVASVPAGASSAPASKRQHRGLGDGHDGGARRHQRPHPHDPRIARAGPEDEEREEDLADRDRLPGQGRGHAE